MSKTNRTVFVVRLFECYLHLDNSVQADSYTHTLGIYTSLELAEKALKDFVSVNKWIRNSVIGSHIIERQLDFEYGESSRDTPDFERIRLYGRDGNFIIELSESSYGSDTFIGTETEAPHHVGDYVYVKSGNRFVISKVVQTPLTKEEWSQRFKNGTCGDWTDDCYTTVSFGLSFHEHPSVTNVFPIPEGAILSDKVRQQLDKLAQQYFEGDLT